jgi:hypothetical protein
MAGIYKVTAPHENNEAMETVGWASSEGAARAKRTEMCEAAGGLKPKQCGIEKIEVPTKKDELIAWLNENVQVLPKG